MDILLLKVPLTFGLHWLKQMKKDFLSPLNVVGVYGLLFRVMSKCYRGVGFRVMTECYEGVGFRVMPAVECPGLQSLIVSTLGVVTMLLYRTYPCVPRVPSGHSFQRSSCFPKCK